MYAACLFRMFSFWYSTPERKYLYGRKKGKSKSNMEINIALYTRK